MAADTVPLDSSLTEMDWLGQLNIRSAAAGGLHDLDNTRSPSSRLTVDHSANEGSGTRLRGRLGLEQNGYPSDCVDDGHGHNLADRFKFSFGTATDGPSRNAKPPFSYTQLIACAINSTACKRMALNDIYQWISDTFPYYKDAAPGWKNSVRHNLSLNKSFVRVARNKDDPGKGAYWALNDGNPATKKPVDVFSAFSERDLSINDRVIGNHFIEQALNAMMLRPEFTTPLNHLLTQHDCGLDELLPTSSLCGSDGATVHQLIQCIPNGNIKHELEHSYESSSSLNGDSSQESAVYYIERRHHIDTVPSVQEQVLVAGTYQLLDNVSWEMSYDGVEREMLVDIIDDEFDWDRLL